MKDLCTLKNQLFSPSEFYQAFSCMPTLFMSFMMA